MTGEGGPEAREVVPLCGKGITRKQWKPTCLTRPTGPTGPTGLWNVWDQWDVCDL